MQVIVLAENSLEDEISVVKGGGTLPHGFQCFLF